MNLQLSLADSCEGGCLTQTVPLASLPNPGEHAVDGEGLIAEPGMLPRRPYRRPKSLTKGRLCPESDG